MRAVQFRNKTSLLCNSKPVLKEDNPRRVTPSIFIQETLQSTKERLRNTAEVHRPQVLEWFDTSSNVHHKASVVEMDRLIFQPYPSELIFQNFIPSQTYKLPLLLLNNDKVPQHVKLEPIDSDLFSVVGPENGSSKVAPGRSATFKVFFTPQENKDYNHRLVCVTQRERFEIPIRAIGPRGILDFRDELHLPMCPVKASTQKTHLVRNIGKCQAKFKLHTQRPFSVTPSSGTLDVGESMQVTVLFQPLTVGDHRQDLLLHYHTGEDVYISLFGTCEELNIHLEPDSLLLQKTYISLANAHTVSLTNGSDVPLQYCWTVWSSQQDEDLRLFRESSVLQQGEEGEEEEEEEEGGPFHPCESDLQQLSGALQEHRSQDSLQALSLSCLTVEPMEGEIWPNTTAQFNIIFKPEEAKLYQHVLYCDVTGREARLPLTVEGEGLGPKLQLSYNLMDMKNVFIGDKDRYEVEMSNKGLIDAPFRFLSVDTTFGRCFSVSPAEGVVPCGACQTVEVTFQSHVLGTFSEDLLLKVTGLPQHLTLTFRGCVVGPTFHFDVYELNFGDVAFGFPSTLACTLFNTSFVPMAFTLRVLGDGLGSPSVSGYKQVSDLSLKNWQRHPARGLRARPVEFAVSPAAGSVRAMSDVTVEVTLCSNTVKKYRLALVVDVDGVGEEILTLPINARCVVPEIVVEPPVLDFQRCYLGQTYEQEVRLTNSSDLPACYGLLDQENEEALPLLFGSSVPRGVLFPGSSKELPVSLVAKAVGRLHCSLHIAVFGSFQQPLEVVLSCTGQGPVVHISSTHLHFGRIPVLTDIIESLQLFNQSPIPACFTSCMFHKGSFWHVEPREGEVPPESQLELKIVAHLKDTLHFQDKLEVSIQDSQKLTVYLSATGSGTTIVSDRPFGPSLDLGTQFSHGSYQYHFKLANHGQRVHRMFWKTDGFSPSTKKQQVGNMSGRSFLPPISSPKQKDNLNRGSSVLTTREKPALSLSPSRVELFPGSSVDMVLTASSDSPKIIRERLVCRGIIGNQGCQETIMSVDVTCRFVAPVLSISSKQLNFYRKKVKGKRLLPAYEKLVLKNVSSLSLSMELSLVEPFFLCDAPGENSSATTKSLVLGDRSQAELWVCFDPTVYNDQVSRVVEELLEIHYLGHPHQDMVKLHAEIHHPDLHFSSTTVDFGCVHNWTETKKVITVTNCSPLPVSYHWAFLDDHKQHNIRDTEVVMKNTEQEYPESQTEEWKSSSLMLASVSSLHPSPRPDADEQSSMLCPVVEVFDILPMYGLLQPGDQQLVTFSFFSHENISREVIAQCYVDDGPTYEIKLKGEASVINYSLESTQLDFGSQLFYCVGEVELIMRNTGKIGFKFTITQSEGAENKVDEVSGEHFMALKVDSLSQDGPQQKDKERQEEGLAVRPGRPVVIPAAGYMDVGTKQHLRVFYLPGIPEAFEEHLQLQVAFLPPQKITLRGVGVFPRISLNLPRNLADECYRDVVSQAKAAVEAHRVREELTHQIAAGEGTAEATWTFTYEEQLHMEIERLLIKRHAAVVSAGLELSASPSSSSQWHKLNKFEVPEYVLDFGFAIPGKAASQSVTIVNNGSMPVSFHAICKRLAGTGFTAKFDRVKNLPSGEAQTFTVQFDFQRTNQRMGETNAILPIQVSGGPQVNVRLRVVVTMPTITVSKDTLQFDTVQCGMCQIQTVQLFNHGPVPCHWSMAEEVKPFKKVDKFLPLYERKKILQEQRPPPTVFEVDPCSGVLVPGECTNVRIKFIPAEGCVYRRRLEVRMASNTQQLFITAQGRGAEPQLEFCPSVLELGPCLPLSTEAEAEVSVKNLCSFPIEFYSLELDTQYLKEEEILRRMQGYDENNTLLLPPRVPGEGLPVELLDSSKLQEDVDSESTGQEMTPVARAVARHVGSDFSSEGPTALNRRGIAIIVYGAPQTDTSIMAANLAGHYGAACLSVDDVVTDALRNGTSAASLSARHLYHAAAADYTQKQDSELHTQTKEDAEPGSAAPPEDSEPNSGPAFLDPVEVHVEQRENNCSRNGSAPHQGTEDKQKGFCKCPREAVPTLSSLLPEQLLVHMLEERFQLRDCHRGIVIDGLKSLYTQLPSSTLQVVLKALNNREHIYVVNLSDTYAALKTREREQGEVEENLQKENAIREENWLWEVDQEVFDALPEEEKERLTQKYLETLQKQKLRELEQKAKEEEQRRQQEEERKQKEEDLKKKNKKGGKKDNKDIPRKRSVINGKQSAGSMNVRKTSAFSNSKESLVDAKEQQTLNEVQQDKEAEDLLKQPEETNSLVTASPQPTDKQERENTSLFNSCKESHMDTREPRNVNEEDSKLQQATEAEAYQKKTEEVKILQTDSPQFAHKPRRETCVVDELQCQFNEYERSQITVMHILQHWDREQGLMLAPVPGEEILPGSDNTMTEKQAAAAKKSKKDNSKTTSLPLSQTADDKPGDTVSSPHIIPHVVFDVTNEGCASSIELLSNGSLPPLEEILDHLELVPSGPPASPPTTFSVVAFPQTRDQAKVQETCFTFLVPSGLEEDKEKKGSEEDPHKQEEKEEASSKNIKETIKKSPVSKDKDKKGKESRKTKIKSSSKTKLKFDESQTPLQTSTSPDFTDQSDHNQKPSEVKRSQSLNTFRWVVPANGQVSLKIWFYSESPGTFEQVFSFELAGTRKLYQLTCRGCCTYPSICKEYKTIFAQSKKVPQIKDELQKAFIIKPGYFEFGPLLCSKSRDRYKENRYPENSERLIIHNNSSLKAEIQFSFQHDTQASTYLLDPPTMILTPGQKQELTVWAYPTKQGQVKDSVVCQIKDNPEPVIVNVSCWGVRPELELESKHLDFGRILLNRRDTCCMRIHNKTLLPVSWRLQGMEELGDEFFVPKEHGIIPPNSSFQFIMHFKAKRPGLIRKILRLEVSDMENILGIVQTENINVTAEACDAALEITPGVNLDFGTIRVFEEAKLSLKLTNKEKYELAFKFIVKETEQQSIFTVSPDNGSLLAYKKTTTVLITCRPEKEALIKEHPLLSCQVIKPNSGIGGETIATIEIKISLQAVFSRYKITPAWDINFGPVAYGTEKTQSFVIENTGLLQTHFTISRMFSDPAVPSRVWGPGKMIPRENPSAKSTGAALKQARHESLQKESKTQQNRLTAGVFSVSPCSGSLAPGAQQQLTVDCVAEQLGTWNQGLLIDISGREPSDQPDGIPYRLLAEVWKPGICLDVASIFEEYFLCQNSSQLSSEQFSNAEGIYVLDENKFIFSKVLVGRTAQARFRLTNNSKDPCVLSLAIKYVRVKTPRNMEVFDLPSTRLNIPNQSHAFAVVTFTPQAMQLYSAVFEATIEGLLRSTPTSKNKVLEFDLIGEGTLPSICVVRPALRSNRGSPVMQFGQVLVGRRHVLPLVLLNDGNVTAQVQIDMLDEHGVFTLKAASGNASISTDSTRPGGTSDPGDQSVHRAVLKLNTNEQTRLELSFCSDKPVSVKAKMRVQVKDNQYSNTTIQVTGEAYQEIVSLGNISKSSQEGDWEDEREGNSEVLHFGDCHVDCTYQQSFSMTNHSSSQVVRFEWPPSGAHITFSPQVGHLHAGCSKEVTVTFRSSQPLTVARQPTSCKIRQVEFEQPIEQVADWDDRQRTVQWQAVSEAPEQSAMNKATKMYPEPVCSAVEGSQLDLVLSISAVCDYVKFSCSTSAIHFKDTMVFQTRIRQLQIVNVGKVKVEFSWQVVMDSNCNLDREQRDETSTSGPGSRSAVGHPSSVLSSVMSLLMRNPDLPPFSLEPSMGTIDPGATQNFYVRFSPVEVAQFQGRLLCSIANLQEGDQAPCIVALGRSLLTHCHFDLEDSDYISNRRRPEFRCPLDPNTRVLEFHAVGLFVPTIRCFNVVNPTSKAYSFKWRCEDTADSHFCCLTSSGTILPGKKVEMRFEYVAEHQDTVESFWSFVIETLSLSVPLLFVGTAREPVVYLDRPHLNFGDLIVDRRYEQTVALVNAEEEPMHFSVLQSSLLSEDQQSSLVLEPLNGSVASKSRLPLTVCFRSSLEGHVRFRLSLKVKRKSESLTLTVKADCFTLSASVQVEQPDGNLKEVVPNHQDTLDFGKVGVSEHSSFNFLVSNLSKFILEVNFEFTGPEEQLQHLEGTPGTATIEAGERLRSTLSFCPQSICNLQDVTLSLKVKLGPTFSFAIRGRAVAPNLEFSFTKFNFGKCFLCCPGMVPPSKTLVIRNKSKQEVSVQCQFKNTAFLVMDFQPDVLTCGAAMEVPVTFCPREERQYHEKLPFIINSCITKHVDIQGHGIEIKLEVKDPRQKTVKLGSLMLGQKVKKQVVLVNHSSVDLLFTLMLSTNTPLDLKGLSVSPADELKLSSSGGSCKVEIQFSPQQHVLPFSAELQAEFSGFLHPLLTIEGSCQGVEVQLDQDYLSFGAVVQHCQSKKRIVMVNTGDIGARFHWKTEYFPTELSITPVKGYISPGMEVPFEVTLAPVELGNDTRYENLPCVVEGCSSSITLTVTGSCVSAFTNKEVLNFVCSVRGSQTQTVSVLNPTGQRCSIRPVIEGKHWSAARFVNFEPHQTKPFDITYQPLTMTTEGKEHLGSVFFSFPDGRGMLYSMQGATRPPKAEGTIVHELPAKTNLCEVLSVNNWLPKQQRFRVLLEFVKPEKVDATVFLKGHRYIEVPALAKREYKISFFAYREEQYNTRVTFCNEATGEYLFYLINFKVTAPGVLSTIKLETPVRRVASATVHVENPLFTAAYFHTECKCGDISAPSQHTVPGQSEGVLSFEYLPLQPGESTTQLSLFSNDLGLFHYNLLLKALPPPPENTVHFSASLGSSHSVVVKFINCSRFKTEYSCKIDCPDFTVDKSVTAAPGFHLGSEVSVEVCFEPHQLGDVKGQLSLNSGSGGGYIFPLHGVCLAPKAQGPFSIRAGHSTTIPFKNVFLQTTAFSVQVDNPCFTVKGVDNIPPKKTQNILVSCEAPPGGPPGPWFGKLTISSQRSEGHTKPCSWVFYLKGQ